MRRCVVAAEVSAIAVAVTVPMATGTSSLPKRIAAHLPIATIAMLPSIPVLWRPVIKKIMTVMG